MIRGLGRSAGYLGLGKGRELRSWTRLSADGTGTEAVDSDIELENLPVRYSSRPW